MPQNQLFLFDFWIDFFNNFLDIDQDQDGMLRVKRLSRHGLPGLLQGLLQ